MPEACRRCGKAGDPPPAQRVPFSPDAKKAVLESICAACWREWEDMEIRVVNEYRLNFLDPQHRAMLQKTCLEFLQLQTP